MLELQLKPSEISVFDKHSQIKFTRNLKKLIRQFINASYTMQLIQIQWIRRI